MEGPKYVSRDGERHKSMTNANKTLRSGVDVGIAVSAAVAQVRTDPNRQAGVGGGMETRQYALGGGLIWRVMWRLAQRLRPQLYRVRQYMNRPLQEQLARVEAAMAATAQLQAQLGRVEAAMAATAQLQAQLGRVEAAVAATAQLQAQLGRVEVAVAATAQLQAQLGRVEQYSQASARRVALPVCPGEILVRTEVGFVFCAASDSALLANLIEVGELESGTRHLIERLLRPGDVFVDVGANIGMHTIAAARVVGPSGRVIAFEPYGPTMRLLEKSVWLNGLADVVQLHETAVSDSPGRQLLYLGKTSGHHSLYRLAPSDSAIEDSIEVPVIRLEEVVEVALPVRLIKIDVEGSELAVIDGCRDLLSAQPGLGIIVEFGRSHMVRAGQVPVDWLQTFRRLGLTYRVIDPVSGQLGVVADEQLIRTYTANLLFARADSPLWEAANA